MTGQSVCERTFPGAVRAHQRVDFTLTNLKVHTLEDWRVRNGNVQIGNLEQTAHGNRNSFFIEWSPETFTRFQSNWSDHN